MTLLQRFRVLWNLSKLVPPVGQIQWTDENTSQLAAFLNKHPTGKRLRRVLQNSAVSEAIRAVQQNDVSRFAAGYMAALGMIDQLSALPTQPNEPAVKDDMPEDDLAFMRDDG